MKSQGITIGMAALIIVGILLINRMEPGRLPEERAQEVEEVKELIEDAEQAEEEIRSRITREDLEELKAVAIRTPFHVKFECSNGTFVVECIPDWAPIGAGRFRLAVEKGLYDEARFFRVVPGFVVQFGIPGDPELAKHWAEKTIEDDEVTQTNAPGTLTFAKTNAPDSRTTQLFINLGGNNRLDAMGFAPFGRVVEGMDVVRAIESKYREQPDQDMIETRGNAYLKEIFGDLDYIKKATIVEGDLKD